MFLQGRNIWKQNGTKPLHAFTFFRCFEVERLHLVVNLSQNRLITSATHSAPQKPTRVNTQTTPTLPAFHTLPDTSASVCPSQIQEMSGPLAELESPTKPTGLSTTNRYDSHSHANPATTPPSGFRSIGWVERFRT
mmetsp:Transcript_9713/g.17516  ORF Transcript_9713/g.17516 Transcript_9713/m.17516 type:complete len:136 (-) Transcript_9713:2220-2627(-)